MSEVEDFIYQFEGRQRKLLLRLHNLLTNEFGLIPKVRYKIPFYDGKSWICYLNSGKDGQVELAFVRGNELSNVQGLLRYKGRKLVRGLQFKELSEVEDRKISELIHEAILLDETVPYNIRRNTVKKSSNN